MKLTSLTAALSFAASPLLAADDMTVLLDWFINPDHGPIIVAHEKGYFAEQDLEVEIIAPADPSDPPKLVAAGKAELAISYQPQLHLQIHEGLPLQRVGTLVATPLNCLLALADGPIQSPADLAGKKVGFSVGGVEEAVLGSILRHHGLSLNDVELVNVNWSLSPSLMSGQVDAVTNPFNIALFRPITLPSSKVLITLEILAHMYSNLVQFLSTMIVARVHACFKVCNQPPSCVKINYTRVDMIHAVPLSL